MFRGIMTFIGAMAISVSLLISAGYLELSQHGPYISFPVKQDVIEYTTADWSSVTIIGDVAHIKLNGVFWPSFDAQMDIIEQKNIKNLSISMFNMGGTIGDMFAIWDRVQRFKLNGGTVITTCYGGIASAGVILYLTGDYRYMSQHSVMMLHPHTLWNYYDKESQWYKTLKDYPTTKTLFEKMSVYWSRAYARIVASETNLRFGEAYKLITTMKADTGQFWFTAEEALKMGFAHELIKGSDESEEG